MDRAVWKVVGGASTGGLLVRTQKGLAAPEASSRLATGSLVKQLALERGRLQYELLVGEGPQSGWVALSLGTRELLVRAEQPEAARHSSRKRIAEAESWSDVLGVDPAAGADELRRAWRELALLHHPDKQGDADDGGEAFRSVQLAYEQGLAVVASRPPPSPVEEVSICPVELTAPKTQLRAACGEFEEKVDLGKSRSVPDDIPYVCVEQVVEWLLEGSCVPIDAREPSDRVVGRAEELPGSVEMGYTRLLKSPDSLLPELRWLQQCADRGLRFVSYSMHGSPSRGNCAIVCCLLVEVFGFDAGIMHCLEDGHLMWRQWARKHKDTLEAIRRKYG